MSGFTAKNHEYILISRACQLPTTVEKSRTAARIIGWARKHHVRWRAPYEDVARRYMTLLNSPQKERGYIGAAARAFKESDIDDTARKFIEEFRITGWDIHDLRCEEGYPDTTWKIVTDATVLVIWSQRNPAREKKERLNTYCQLINVALKAADLSITSDFAAMLYVLLLSDKLNPTSLNENGLSILDYQETTDLEKAELGRRLNKIGLIVERGISHWLQRACLTSPNLKRGSVSPEGRYQKTFASISGVTPRGTRLADEARIRDGNRCAVSHRKGIPVEVCHILAYSIGSGLVIGRDLMNTSPNSGSSWPCFSVKSLCTRYMTT
ncbi:hypothetical protein TWF481_003937 [Arthrobotrys musiformis]|uniref:HNH nuclease domain-containing protein n=1 Tax=Arthrobotrys musiformis TaxID=47236 RepID=A0AAV9WJ04_9PEZI